MIRIFVTGGTFDKNYDEIRGRLSFGDTHLGEMLRLGRSRVQLSVRTLMMVDSLDMTADQRQAIADACANASFIMVRLAVPSAPPARATSRKLRRDNFFAMVAYSFVKAELPGYSEIAMHDFRLRFQL